MQGWQSFTNNNAFNHTTQKYFHRGWERNQTHSGSRKGVFKYTHTLYIHTYMIYIIKTSLKDPRKVTLDLKMLEGECLRTSVPGFEEQFNPSKHFPLP